MRTLQFAGSRKCRKDDGREENGCQESEQGSGQSLLSCQTAEEERGAEGQNRTGDTRIFSPLLYRLSYLGMNPSETNQSIKGPPDGPRQVTP